MAQKNEKPQSALSKASQNTIFYYEKVSEWCEYLLTDKK